MAQDANIDVQNGRGRHSRIDLLYATHSFKEEASGGAQYSWFTCTFPLSHSRNSLPFMNQKMFVHVFLSSFLLLLVTALDPMNIDDAITILNACPLNRAPVTGTGYWKGSQRVRVFNDGSDVMLAWGSFAANNLAESKNACRRNRCTA